jgi:secretion/DNA translocation related TadE-like protein
VWVVVAGLLVLLAATVVVARTEAVLARHRAGVAADLAALAAAGQIGVRPPSELCAAATKVAAADGASLISCRTDLDPGGRVGAVLVTVAIDVSLPFVGRQQVHASARAARLPGRLARPERVPCGCLRQPAPRGTNLINPVE